MLQFKPGLLIDRDMCDEILTRLDAAVGQARAELFGRKASAPKAVRGRVRGGSRHSERTSVASFDDLPHEEKLKRLEQVARAAVAGIRVSPRDPRCE